MVLKTDQIAWELKLDEGVRPMTMEVIRRLDAPHLRAALQFNGFASWTSPPAGKWRG